MIRLLQALVAGSLLLALGPLASASAAPPSVTISSPAAGSLSKEAAPALAGTTSDLIDFVIVRIYEGVGTGGTVVQTLQSEAPSAGTWNVAPTALADGTYTALAEQIELGTLEPPGMSEAVTFTIDTTPPNVTLDQVAALTNDPTPTFGGSIGTAAHDEPSVTLDIYAGPAVSGTPIASEKASVGGGGWSYTSTPLADGVYTVQASQRDEAGNVGESAARTFTLDTKPPAVSLTPLAPVVGSSKPSFGGQAGTAPGDIASVKLMIYAGSVASGSSLETLNVTPVGGSWTATPANALGDGTYTAIAEQFDEAGNRGLSEPSTFTVKTKGPAVSLGPVSEWTNDPTPTFGGSIGTAAHDEPAVTLDVYAGSAVSGTPIVSEKASVGGGGWSYTSTPLADGVYTVQASQRDEAGNVGESAARTFTLDTKPPAVSLTPLAPVVGSSKPSFGGQAGTAPGDIASVKLMIYAGSVASGSSLETLKVTPSGGGSWAATPAKALGDGTYTAIAEQFDEAGNRGLSEPSTFTVKTKGPAVSLNSVATPTNDPTPTFGGSIGTAAHDEPAITVDIYAGPAVNETPIVSEKASVGGGGWSYTSTPLADGVYTVQASQRDEAGNVGESAARTFTLDTKPPAVSLTPLATVVSTTKPSFGGNAGTAAGDIGSVKLTIYAGTAALGSPVETLKVTPSGGGSWAATPAKALGDGTYTAIAEQFDEAGNRGLSEPSTFTVKTKGPAVSLGPVSEWTNDPTPTFGGSIGTAAHDEPAVTLDVYPGTAEKGSKPLEIVQALVSGSTWTATPTKALADGTYTAIAKQFDEAHNEGVSVARTFTIDTVAPVVTLSGPSVSTGVETVSGAAGTAHGDHRQVTVELFAGASVEPSNGVEAITVNATAGAWTATFANLAPGEYTVLARQSDEAGNVGASEAGRFTVTALPAPTPGAAPTPSPPVASFTWVPANPTIGQSVSLVSSSTDPSSAIGAFAWDVAGSGQFAPGGAVMTTSFATPGAHLVRLRVSDGNGLTSTAAQTIDVAAPPPRLMQPFPIVRIAGSETSYGVRLKLLTVQAPLGARVQVACVGRACKTKPESRLAAASSKTKAPTGAVMLAFTRFERPLRAGVTLQIRVTRIGEIGKFTSFAIRRNKLPVRNDACLQPTSSKPSPCPSS